ncbi:Cell cycle checkpoint protein RAD17 [Psilocybe cubensis]|uniref:Checkpoint protein RAD24-like helical bundle domain-containing protein n=2 Tax=Psilocybe cubensis TaxID=181762 RepID=A0A8H8CJC9_PSICU|nr:Cell cycle checkpoint protein RAD17 [Psilocybe cubensis]KAH9475883.1 Cell cycle checkpoint protein RAD17 [Psilocybe cubensis]
MAPKSQAQTQPQVGKRKPTKSSSLHRTVRLDGERIPSSSAPSRMTRMDPLTAFSKSVTTVSTVNKINASQSQGQKFKGKGKAKIQEYESENSGEDGQAAGFLWVDKYEPMTEAQLAVHARKVEDVRRWFDEAFEGGPSGKLTKYRRILVLTGPSGTGKTATVRVLAKEMGFEIMEWKNTIGEAQNFFSQESNTSDYEGLFTKFEAFLARASTCHNIFASSSAQKSKNRRIILLEDLPNILHSKTQTQFHEALHALVSAQSANPVPVVIIISDSGLRGEATDERRAEAGGWGWGKDKTQIIDVRTVLPKDLLGGQFVTEISFNPIAPTLLRKALQAMLSIHFSRSSASAPSKEVLDTIVESANGDIRSAIMALQFACIIEFPGRGKKRLGEQRIVLEAVTRREQSLALFHLLGKVLYNKRMGDPPSASASAKDLQKERDIDAALKPSVKLPVHLHQHDRRASRVNVESLYADSPIDTSLFSLYIHQNYTQFCNEVEESEDLADWLSWIDASGGDMWYQANPHQFHLLTLGTLHSLPSPVPRRSQKYYKPEFFGFLQKEKDAWDSVCATRDWLIDDLLSRDGSGWRAGGWTKNDVVLEVGGVLKAQDAIQNSKYARPPPPVHKLFSQMTFTRTGNTVRASQLDERDDFQADQQLGLDRDLDMVSPSSIYKMAEEKGGWLESDDIDEF